MCKFFYFLVYWIPLWVTLFYFTLDYLLNVCLWKFTSVVISSWYYFPGHFPMLILMIMKKRIWYEQMNWTAGQHFRLCFSMYLWFCVTLMCLTLWTKQATLVACLIGVYSLITRESRVQRVNFTDWFCFQRWIYEFFHVFFSEIKCCHGNGSSKWQNVAWDFRCCCLHEIS